MIPPTKVWKDCPVCWGTGITQDGPVNSKPCSTCRAYCRGTNEAYDMAEQVAQDWAKTADAIGRGIKSWSMRGATVAGAEIARMIRALKDKHGG